MPRKKATSAPAATVTQDPQDLHRIPVIDKMMQIIEYVQAAGAPASISAITAATRIPRSTVYRVLNTLASHGILSRRADGDFALGYRLVSLAAGVDTTLDRADIVRIAHPHLAALANAVGETCKLSVLDDLAAEVVDVVQSSNAMAPSSRVGSRFELHAGAASKLLLAFAPAAVAAAVTKGTLTRFTDRTHVETASLTAELATIRAESLSRDEGEWNANVHALAAPIFGPQGTVVAAISVTYFASEGGDKNAARLIAPLKAAAAAISQALGHYPPSTT